MYRRIPLVFRQAVRRGTVVETMELLSEFKKVKIVQRNWPGGKDQANEELERWDLFRSSVAEPLVRQWREHRYEPLLRVVRPAMEVYERIKAAAGKLSYQDLLMKAAGLLRDGSAARIREYFRHRFTHVLVDEFQDTDPVQAQVIMLLTAENSEETDWRKCRPVPGSLFVVGDPKQSIYRFRRADIVTYNQVKRIIERHGGKVVNLTANFRTIRPLVDWVNKTFSGEFGKHPAECSPDYVALDAVREDRIASDLPPVRCVRVPKDFKTNDKVGEYEADIVVNAIGHAIHSGLRVTRRESEGSLESPGAEPGDFLIVTQNKKNLSLYSRKLQEAHIPHQVSGGKALNQVEELKLLHRCLDALT
ncbi:MAG: UvrD-helicase domain-containing protein, partial [Deltaproteobacteria bacterium]|nr:UvrD-helicase domain-containing protein [Deltaproteobacteria bacterium]